jgi:hypothetical protein
MIVAKIPKIYQMMILLVIIVSAVFFFLYFYRQASNPSFTMQEVNFSSRQSNRAIDGAITNMDIGLLSSDKFIDLRADVAPAQSFQSGKRNPFESQ